MPAAPSSPAHLVRGHLHAIAGCDLPGPDAVPTGLLDALAQVPDPRDPRGVRYGFVSVLAVAVCPTLAGVRSYAAVAKWAIDAPAGAGLTRPSPWPGHHLAGADRRGSAGAGQSPPVPGSLPAWHVLSALNLTAAADAHA